MGQVKDHYQTYDPRDLPFHRLCYPAIARGFVHAARRADARRCDRAGVDGQRNPLGSVSFSVESFWRSSRLLGKNRASVLKRLI